MTEHNKLFPTLESENESVYDTLSARIVVYFFIYLIAVPLAVIADVWLKIPIEKIALGIVLLIAILTVFAPLAYRKIHSKIYKKKHHTFVSGKYEDVELLRQRLAAQEQRLYQMEMKYRAFQSMMNESSEHQKRRQVLPSSQTILGNSTTGEKLLRSLLGGKTGKIQ